MLSSLDFFFLFSFTTFVVSFFALLGIAFLQCRFSAFTFSSIPICYLFSSSFIHFLTLHLSFFSLYFTLFFVLYVTFFLYSNVFFSSFYFFSLLTHYHFSFFLRFSRFLFFQVFLPLIFLLLIPFYFLILFLFYQFSSFTSSFLYHPYPLSPSSHTPLFPFLLTPAHTNHKLQKNTQLQRSSRKPHPELHSPFSSSSRLAKPRMLRQPQPRTLSPLLPPH